MLFVVLVTFFSSMAFANQWQSKNVLVLHSYSSSYQWTADFQKGIEEALANSNSKVRMSLEFLDTKRIFHKAYLDEFTYYFDSKYKDYSFDAVLVTDDNALELINRWPGNRFAGLPIIAAGINNPKASLEGVTHQARIFYEQDEVEKTFELIRRFRPNLERLYYIADKSKTSELIREKTIAFLSQYPQATIVEIRDLPLADVGRQLREISPNDAVILTHYNTAVSQGVYHRYQYIAHEIASNSVAPVFVFWEFYIKNGVVGGYVNRSKSLGKQMVYALNEFIEIGSYPPLEEGSSARPVFDYHAFQRHGFDANYLPNNALLLNKPESFIEKNWRLLLIVAAIFLTMSTIIITQAISIKQKRELNKKNKKIVRLQKKTLKTQKDMIVMLGEAIETRSGETGNHVKRVAQLSSSLAKIVGLTHREIELIEIVSPMHDVGKIAIPEAILDKPGKLDEQEWAIMQTHTSYGYHLLNASRGEIFHLAATVAHEHHERWDGQGYPNGLAGEEIHIFSRITAIADVFDALLSERCYKQAWPLAQVVEHFQNEKGAQFDPHLTQLLLDNLDLFIDIRDDSPDKT
ncbi:HD domain-containing phosphohydrolase [Vibrio renipiscarius]|uniref:HD domain-containing phosphohydrolase n=1 Tax=Vibrio renipiscarius TaxID=1461322 RepID=UPI00354C63B3